MSENRGGGIFCSSASSPTITNCTITGNTTNSGGGIYCENSSSPTVINSILWGDEAGGISNEIHLASSSTIEITYSDIQGGYTGTGNIDADPLFVDTTNADYHLQTGSPCINLGTTTGVPEYDFEGDPRLASVGGDNMPDIGADEAIADLFSPVPTLTEWGILLLIYVVLARFRKSKKALVLPHTRKF